MNRRFLLIPAVALVASVFASVGWAALRSPRIGIVRQQDGTLHPVFGISANLICGDAWNSAPASASSFSDNGGFVYSSGELTLLSDGGAVAGRYAVSETHPLLDMESALDTAVAWLPSQRTLVYWDGKSFIETPVNMNTFSGTVKAIRATNKDNVEFLVSEAGATVRAVLSLRTGDTVRVEPVPGIVNPDFALGSFVLFHNDDELSVQAPDGTRRGLGIREKDLSFEKASSHWLHISSANGRQWLLHLDQGAIELSELPAAISSSANSSVTEIAQ